MDPTINALLVMLYLTLNFIDELAVTGNLIGLTFVSLLTAAFVSGIWFIGNNKNPEDWVQACWKLLCHSSKAVKCWIALIILTAIIPSGKSVLLIVGAYYGTEALNGFLTPEVLGQVEDVAKSIATVLSQTKGE